VRPVRFNSSPLIATIPGVAADSLMPEDACCRGGATAAHPYSARTIRENDNFIVTLQTFSNPEPSLTQCGARGRGDRSVDALGPQAAIGGLIQFVLGFGHVLPLILNLRCGQANPRSNAVPRDDFIAAIEDLIVTPQHRIACLDEAEVDVAAWCSCGRCVVRRGKRLRRRFQLGGGCRRRFSGAWCARACRRQCRGNDQSNSLDVRSHSSPFVSGGERPRRAAHWNSKTPDLRISL
jgi:hypothetical protein